MDISVREATDLTVGILLGVIIGFLLVFVFAFFLIPSFIDRNINTAVSSILNEAIKEYAATWTCNTDFFTERLIASVLNCAVEISGI